MDRYELALALMLEGGVSDTALSWKIFPAVKQQILCRALQAIKDKGQIFQELARFTNRQTLLYAMDLSMRKEEEAYQRNTDQYLKNRQEWLEE